MRSSRNDIRDRRERILRTLRERGSVDVSSLAELLEVSEITIRRDLTAVARTGMAERYYGGIRLAELRVPGFTAVPREPGIEEAVLESLAAKAAGMIEANDVVFMNSSETVMRVIKYIRVSDVVVVTNNARAANLPREAGVELILTGGLVQGGKQSMVGEYAQNVLSKIKATKCVIGVSGISVRGGITSEILSETAINQMMLRRCSGSRIVVTDGSKVGRERNFQSGHIADVTHLITDASADVDELEQLRAKGLHVTLVDKKH